MKMNPKLFVSKKLLECLQKRKMLPTDNLITLAFMKQVSGLIWGFGFIFVSV